METATATSRGVAPPASLCARCGGSAPQNFVFCLACAVGITDNDPSGETLLASMTNEYTRLQDKLAEARKLRDGLPRCRERSFVDEQIQGWTKKLATLGYVLQEWR